MLNRQLTLLFADRDSEMGRELLFGKIEQYLGQSYFNPAMMLAGSSIVLFVGHSSGSLLRDILGWYLLMLAAISMVHFADWRCRQYDKWDDKRIAFIWFRSIAGFAVAGLFGASYVVLPQVYDPSFMLILTIILAAVVFGVFINNTLFPEYYLGFFCVLAMSAISYVVFYGDAHMAGYALILTGLCIGAVLVIIPKLLVMTDIAIEAMAVKISLEREVLDHIKTKKIIEYQALHDSLTGVANRRKFKNDLDTLILERKASGNHFAVLYIDLNGFKSVNDNYGHAAGDKLLVKVCNRLISFVGLGPNCEMVARIGGDEFCLLYSNISLDIDWVNLASDLKLAISAPIVVNEQSVSVGASVGVGIYPQHGTTHDELLGHADRQMYQDKIDGKLKRRSTDSM
jgi:diguanylate cyclase (GGDEF)-like protein